MNLHSIVSPYIGAVNPLVSISVRISVGQAPTLPDGSRPPRYATPGGLTGSIAGSVLSVTALSAGFLQAGQTLADLTAALAPGTSIIEQLSGEDGGIGTYTVSKPQTVASEDMTTALTMLAQVQPITWKDLQQLDGINMNGDKKAVYVNGSLDGNVRVALKGGDLVTLPDGSVWLVAQQLEGFNMTAGWTKAAIVLQDGS